jgi:hypothetical protein
MRSQAEFELAAAESEPGRARNEPLEVTGDTDDLASSRDLGDFNEITRTGPIIGSGGSSN